MPVLSAQADVNDIVRDSSNTGECPFVGGKSAACTTFTFSLTVGTNSNRLLIGASAVNGANPTVTMTWTVGVTTQTFTRIGNFQGSGGGADTDGISMFSLVAPTSGSGTITVTSTQSKKMCAGAMGFYNVAQANPTASSSTGSNASPSITVSTADRHLVVDAMSNSTGSTGVSGVGTDQTQQYAIDTNNGNGGGGETGVAASSKPGCTSPGSCPATTTMTWTLSANDKWEVLATDLSPATTPTASTLTDFTATRCGAGTALRWHTDSEVGTLGFDLYRQEYGALRRVNDRLIPASMLNGLPVYVSRWYTWHDTRGSGTWWLEERDSHGNRSLLRAATIGNDAAVCNAPDAGSRPLIRSGPLLRSFRTEATSAVAANRRRTSSPPLSDLQKQWQLAASPSSCKVVVDHDAVYRMTRAELADSGFAITDPKTLQLFNQGRQVPLLQDGDGAGSIEFIGRGVDLPSTASNVYWLIQGDGNGLRVPHSSETGGAAQSARQFPFTIELDERSTYIPVPLGNESKRWWGPPITTEGTSVSLTVQHRALNSEAQAVVQLFGPGSGAHAVRVVLNGADVETIRWNGPLESITSFDVSAVLTEGVNRLTFTNLDPEDGLVVGIVRVDYAHTYDADGDSLRFTATGGEKTTVTGFSTAAIRVFDTTDAGEPRELASDVAATGASFAVTLTPPGTGTHELIALTAARFENVREIRSNHPSHLHDLSNRGAYLVVTRGEFAGELAPLTSLRQSQGLSTAVADVDDLYDEFAFGVKTVDAITDFLTLAKTWREPPRFLLLAGDASFDPRNYLGLGDFDLVPTMNIDTPCCTQLAMNASLPSLVWPSAGCRLERVPASVRW